jgi:hypothetical protein
MIQEKPKLNPEQNKKRTGKKKYHQGFFKPLHPEKIIGDPNNIMYRSGLELKYFKWADKNPYIVEWGSEVFVIPYIFSMDQRKHNYFTDMVIKVRQKDKTLKTFIIEIKPSCDLKPPKKGKRLTPGFIRKCEEYKKNQDKWKYARMFCESRGYEFKIKTEIDLKRKK